MPPIVSLMDLMITNKGNSVLARSSAKPVMLIFLRHFGCTFCRQALSDLSARKSEFEEKGMDMIFVHMASNEIADEYFEKYKIPDPTYISDPECSFYQGFGLTKGTFNQLFGLHTWLRGFKAGVLDGHGLGPKLGDDFQMPGIFIIKGGEIQDQFIHKLASDRPDYEALVECCVID